MLYGNDPAISAAGELRIKMRSLATKSILLISNAFCAFAHADIITVEGIVKAVDNGKRTITVETSTKEMTLDIGGKAKITKEGKEAKLDSLKAGQKISASFHDKLEVVVAVEILKDGGEEITLFNGDDLTGWSLLTHKATKDPGKNTWIVDSDRKVLASTGEDWNELRTDEKFDNFQLSLEWRFTPGRFVSGNGSGIVVRSNGLNTIGFDPRGVEIDFRGPAREPKEVGLIVGHFVGYSMPIKNHAGETLGETEKFNTDLKRYPSRHLAPLGNPKPKSSNQWNTTEITCEGDRIKVNINGILVNEGWGVPEESGHICLRNQNSSVEFRNIKLIKK